MVGYLIMRLAMPSPHSRKGFGAALDRRCETCGYNLKGITSPQCPECGTVRQTHRTHLDVRAVEIVLQNKAKYEGTPQYREASEADFAGLDRRYYEGTTEELVRLGFRPAGDVVFKSHKHVCRILISSEGTTSILIYHINPMRVVARLRRTPLRMCHAQTEFGEGRFLETLNREEMLSGAHAPETTFCHLPLGTSVQTVLEEHERRKQQLIQESGTACASCATLADVMAAQVRQHEIERVFRRRIGYVDPEAYRRRLILDGNSPEVAERFAKALDTARRRLICGDNGIKTADCADGADKTNSSAPSA